MAKRKIGLQWVFDENLKKDTNLPATDKLAFDDLGDFIEERERIKRFVDRRIDTDLKVDYSEYANHVFFDSAVTKNEIAYERILQKYPFNGNREEKDAFFLTGSGYEKYVFEKWPGYVGYAELDGATQYISASDPATNLWFGSSSLYVSLWMQPVVSDQNMIIQYLSASSDPFVQGYEMYMSGADDPHVKFSLYSGSQLVSVSAAYSPFTASFNNVGVIYDQPAGLLSLYINDVKYASSSANFNLINIGQTSLYVGSGSQPAGAASSSYGFYSGSLDEIRVLHTASELYHRKNYNRPIDAESYVKLRYSFNESVTGNSALDKNVVDYSTSALHGTIVGYSSDVRVSGNVMLEDPGDPILYSSHSDVIAFTGSAYLSASVYDAENNNQIFNLIAGGVLERDDNENGLLTSFSLAMARYFDEIKLYIDQLVNLRVTNYDGLNETPDLFLTNLNRYFGWKVSEHFSDANPLEFLFGENILSSGSLNTPLYEIRNQFWRRILNNLPLLMKSRGSRANLDYLFNTIGLNRYNFSLKEYGYLPGTSIQDERISKERVSNRLGIGTGSFSASFVQSLAAEFATDPQPPGDDFTVEVYTQLPFASASYTNTLLTGALWQTNTEADSGAAATGSIRCYWIRDSLISDTGKVVLEASSSLDALVQLSTSDLQLFDGEWVNVAAGCDAARLPFISVRKLDVDTISLTEDATGASAIFATSDVDFSGTSLYVGAHTASILYGDPLSAEGYFGEARYWDKKLSGSEVDDHTHNYQSVGVRDPFTDHPFLRAHWALDENLTSNADGRILNIIDLSRQSRNGTGVQFPASYNSYDKFLHTYNYLSPTIDLKWSENKIRIRNKERLEVDEVSYDTNEMSLEFSFIEALNEDIVKIFSTLDTLNNFVGQPIFKYRDEYSDLEGVRSQYFQRLGDSLNFSQFFDLFKWYDRKISDAIKQLLPARVKFIGGEQVVESHLLERPRYKYHYPLFRTPQDPPEAVINVLPSTSGTQAESLSGDAFGTYARTIQERSPVLGSKEKPSLLVPEGGVTKRNVSLFSAGEETVDRHPQRPTDAEVYTQRLLMEQSSSWKAWNGMTLDSNGALYVTGEVDVSGGADPGDWGIRAPAPGSNLESWSTLLVESGEDGSFDYGQKIVVDTNGALYACGTLSGTTGYEWVVLRSHITASDEWIVSDQFQLTASQDCIPSDISIDSSDVVYVCGKSFSDVAGSQWVVKLHAGDDTWELSDFLFKEDMFNEATSVSGLVEGGAVVVGRSGSSAHSWVARKTADGVEWEQTEALVGEWPLRPVSVRENPLDGITYVVGLSGNSGGDPYWFVRQGAGGQDFEDYETLPTTPSTGSAIVFVGEQAYLGGRIGSELVLRKAGGNNSEKFLSIGSTVLNGTVTDLESDSLGNIYATTTSTDVAGVTSGSVYMLTNNPKGWVFRRKTSGNTAEDIHDPDSGVNYRYQQAKSARDVFEQDVVGISNTLEATASFNSGVFGKVLESLRQYTFFSWEQINSLGSDATIQREVTYKDVATYNDKIYTVGYVEEGSGTADWHMYGIVREGKRTGQFKTVDAFSSSLSSSLYYGGKTEKGTVNSIAIDSSGALYTACWNGRGDLATTHDVLSGALFVRKSHVTASSNWNNIDVYMPDDGVQAAGIAVEVDSNDYVYVLANESGSVETGGVILRKSEDRGATWTTYDHFLGKVNNNMRAQSVGVNSSDEIYYAVTTTSGSFVRKGTTSGSFATVYDETDLDQIGPGGGFLSLCVSSLDNVYVGGVSGSISECFVFSSSDDTNWPIIHSSESSLVERVEAIAEDSEKNIYITTTAAEAAAATSTYIRTVSSPLGTSGTFEEIDYRLGGAVFSVHVGADDRIYIPGSFLDAATLSRGVVRTGKRATNSGSLSQRSFATSYNYARSAPSGSTDSRWALNNVSEFPHNAGLYQMRNIVLGTKDTGKIGRNDDAILQVNYFGSIVYVMWPIQSDQDATVLSFGDLSPGQRPGRLSGEFQAGDTIDVGDQDHMTLYCYLQKQVSGTLDNIEVRVERKPLKDTGFSVDQAIEYASSGSVTTATLTDLVYKKQIDYGDLSIREIAYPIDIPLTNVKQVRISAKQTIGQSDEKNRNLIVWGRLIKSEEET